MAATKLPFAGLRIDAYRITLDDMVMFEDGDRSARFMRDLLSRFVHDEDGEYLEASAAQKAVGSLNLGQLESVFDQFGDKLKELKGQMVPPNSSGS